MNFEDSLQATIEEFEMKYTGVDETSDGNLRSYDIIESGGTNIDDVKSFLTSAIRKHVEEAIEAVSINDGMFEDIMVKHMGVEFHQHPAVVYQIKKAKSYLITSKEDVIQQNKVNGR